MFLWGQRNASQTGVQSMRGNDGTGDENHAHGVGRREQRGGARHQILLPQLPGPQQGNRRGEDRDVSDTRGGVLGGKVGPGMPDSTKRSEKGRVRRVVEEAAEGEERRAG